jgi:MFS family permease
LAIAEELQETQPWYAQVTRYQWLVLIIASAGWVFDVFEGQLFNITRGDMMRELLAGADQKTQKWWGDLVLAGFLLGGTVGGIVFGNLADRYGRKPAMIASIIFYSVFSALTYFASSLWQVTILRFLVGLGVGGEWAVAAALVAEVFPPLARARAGGIFHATSVLGTWMAALAGLLVGTNWRYAYLIGLAPALLVLGVRSSIREPERWQEAGSRQKKLGSFRDLAANPLWFKHAILGLLLAAVGLGTFWGVVVAGQDLVKDLLIRTGADPAIASQKAKFAYGIIQTLGMGIGLLAFGPISERLGRRGAFLLMHIAAIIIVPIACYVPQTYGQMLAILPIFGFFTGGIHAGYAIYFPELFPNHLRATGTGICFNGGRLIAAPLLWLSASLKARIDLQLAVTLLAGLFLIGALLLPFLPETKGKPLPE